MNTKLFIFLLCLLPFYSFSQDLIVTEKGDSLNCKITKEKSDYIYFTFKHENEVRNTLLPANSIIAYEYNFWQTPVVLDSEIKTRRNYKRTRVAFNTGLSYRTASLPDNISSTMKDHLKSLKSGFHIGCDLTSYTSESLGFGLKYNLAKSSSNNEKVSIHYIGPTASIRLLNHTKTNAFISSWSIGYMSYKDVLNSSGKDILTGRTVGLTWDLGYDFKVSEKAALGFQISLLTGSLTKVDYNNQTIELDEDEYEGLGRIDFSVGLRF